MPRVVTARCFKVLWVAATLNDSDRLGRPRFGFTEYGARRRACRYA